MNNIHYCVQKGGVGTMLGLFHGLFFSCGAGSPCSSEVKLRVHGSSMGVVKNINTGMYKSTPPAVRGSKCICHFPPNPTEIMDSWNTVKASLNFVLLKALLKVEYLKQNCCCAQLKFNHIKKEFKMVTERNCGADILNSMQERVA